MSSFIEDLCEIVLGASLADLNAAREIIDEAIEDAEAKAVSVGRSVEEILSMSNAKVSGAGTASAGLPG